MKIRLLPLILMFATVNPHISAASSDDAWAELDENSKATCIELSKLTAAVSLTKYPNQFEENVLVLVRGERNPQSIGNGQLGETATFACLYNKITLKAEISDLATSAYLEQNDEGETVADPSKLNPLSCP